MRSLSLEFQGGVVFNFDGSDGLYAEEALTLHSHAWEYDLGVRAVSNVRATSKMVEMPVKVVHAPSKVDELRRCADLSVMSNTPARLTADGSVHADVFVVGVKTDSLMVASISQITLSIVIIGGLWVREHVFTQPIPRGSDDSVYLDYPHNYPYDYSQGVKRVKVHNVSSIPADFRLQFFGACINPVLTIGGNKYAVDVSVNDGGVVAIDSRSKTVEMTDRNGFTVSVFDKAHRGRGQGGGEYIFERVPVGDNPVSWNGQYAYTLTLYEVDTQPPFDVVEGWWS